MTSESPPTWEQLREQAAAWLARMDSGSADPADFEAWRNADPRHATAFAQIVSVTRRLDQSRAQLKTELPRSKPINRRHLMFAGFAIAGGLGASLAFSIANARVTIKTAIGQRQSVDLPRGAKMQVNTDSEVQWKEDDQRLSVWLKRGEVALQLSDPNQVCELFTPLSKATFSRSAINARLRSDTLDLAVVAGRCSIKPRQGTQAATKPPTIVNVKQAVVATANQQVVRPLSTDDLSLISSWPDGELVVQGQSLDTVIAEYNRYLDRKIIIADPSLSSIRIGGRFTTRDPKVFLDALHDGFGLRIVDDGTGPIMVTQS